MQTRFFCGRKMPMKFIKSGQLAGSPAVGHRRWGGLLLVAAASLGVASLLTACDQFTGTLTVDFVYVTSAKAAGPNQYGEINVFEINSQSGRMRQIPASPFPSGGRNPVSEAIHPDDETLYVVNRDDNTIVQFAIGTDGKLYPQNTVNTPGIFPVATAVAGTSLFVANTYVPLPTCSPASPCTGSVTAFPIAQKATTVNGRTFEADALLTGIPLNSCNGPAYLPLQLGGAAASDILAPTSVSASAKSSLLFVTAKDTTSGAGYLFGYTIGSASCTIGGASVSIVTMSPLAGSPWAAGTSPSAVVQDPNGSFVYVTDAVNNNVLGFTTSGGTLTAIPNSPFAAGNAPSAIVIDKTGTLAYVANSLDSTITGYKIAANGALQAPATFASDTQPVAIGIDPGLNQYLFTANFLANTVSGFQIDSATGSLVNSQFSPYTASANPTAVAAIPHGSAVKK
jgi:6-phosphogluconolactonase (cycloisomerase 2 family)